ncbi:InlB B-repeat-containing protein [Hymenobacter negativus]|uniref:PQQ-dependent sugar dehydrogenase n=1 Tax=Hymenobacter negativus TaxID=2795026 RepID=A0ABS0Q9M0_9BACT|nr:PQQ-dependent sugar dehydrogenase [Hymenobacter negativus]MBH8559379.1 PQQ-dependent sugar dehydrogenase [Hymenobacter negativus]
MKSSLTCFMLAFLLACCCGRAQAQTPPTGFTSTTVSSGWNEAVGLTFNSTGSKMFVWERPGKVWVVVNGQRQQLIDITEEVGAWEDQGLLGFALDPNFNTNGYMYLLYVVDRHYLMNFGTASYDPTANDYYSATIGRLTRYTATPSGTGYTVNPASRKILLGATKTNGIPSTFNGHVTAALQFGSDGTLLVATGDGAHPYPDFGAWTATYAPQALADGIIKAKEDVGSLRAQLVDCYNGKILRLDPSNGNGIASNPYYDAANPDAPRSKVWALGFRNPFRMTLKPGTGSTDPTQGNPGTIYLGDVGAANWEEVDVVSGPRQNFGWPLFEGLTPYDAFTTSNVYNRDAPNPLYNTGGCTNQFFYFQDLIKQATPTGTATFPNSCNTAQTVPSSIPTFVHVRPLIDWGHPATGPSRTGTFSGSTATTANIGAAGSPVTGSQFGGSASTGGVFYPYTDFPLQYRNTYFFGDYVGGWVKNLTVNSSNQPSAVGDFVPSGAVPVAFATSPGETGLFYVNFYPSEIRKISYVTTASPPVAVATSNKTYGPGPLAVQFTGSGSSDPNGGALTYLWNFGDGTATSTSANPSHTFSPPTSAPTNYTVTLTVTNPQGLSNQATLTISANNTPPQVTITSPAVGTLYPLTGNTTYQLAATVTDAEQSGHLLSYQWQTILHHQSHEHPDPVDTTRQTSTTIVPYGCGTETYYYRIVLTVTDAGGLSTTQEVRLDPNCNATSFTLVDADAATDVDIQPLTNGAILNLATLPTRNLNIRANANPATTGSVVFTLTGPQNQNQTESVAPYALFSDVNGDYNAWTPPVGNYQLTATPYSGSGGTGTPGTALTVSFTVTDTGTPGPFTLTTAVFGSGTITKSPNQTTYANGTNVTLTATPAAGFAFTGWSGGATGTTNPLTVTMNANKSITATFTSTSTQQLTSFTLVSADSNADIQTLTAGATLNLATLPTRNLNIRANTNPGTVGSVVFALSGAQTQNQTESVAPYALFSDTGGAYAPWTPPVGSYSLTAAPFTNAGGGGTAGTPLTLAFSVIDQAGPTYTLTVNTVGSGTVSKNPNAASYASGTNVMLTATPATGYTFTGWSGGATGSTNPLTVAMTANKSITATFTAVPTYTLTVNTTGSGTVTKTPNQTSYASGSTVSLQATPAAGYTFSGWSGGATGTTNPLTVTMTANKTITATFTATTTTYTLTTATVGSGTITKNPNQTTYLSGTNVVLTATPATGYTFTGWSGGATGSINPLTVAMTANKSITATFTATPTNYTLTVNTVGSGTVTKNPNATNYASGTNVVLTATPATGYTFTGWSGSATGTTNPLTVAMTANKTITATFTASGQQVTSLILVNADSDVDIQPLTTGAVLNLATLPTPNLTVRATTSPATVGSVLFVLSGAQSVNHNENLAPYALFADSNGDYNPWTPAIAVGSYTLTVTPYSAADNGGTAGTPLSVSFTVTNQAARVAAATAASPTRPSLGQAAAYPNPSADGRYFLRLPDALHGAVRYRLLTALGATVATGTLPADAPVQRLDFSHEINAAGLYYLLLENDHAAAQLKLLRQ